MFKYFVPFSLGVALAVSPIAFAGDDAQEVVRSISVQAHAKVDEKPNLALVNINIQEQAKKLEDAQAATNKQLKALESVAKKFGIGADKIQTMNSSTQPRYRYHERKRIFEGYNVSHRIQIKAEEIAKVGELIDALTKGGIDQIDNVSYTVKDEEMVKVRALAKAVEAAKAKAEAMAKAAGASLGDVITINESGAHFAPVMARAKGVMMMADAEMEAAPELPAGGVSVNANVNVTFELD